MAGALLVQAVAPSGSATTLPASPLSTMAPVNGFRWGRLSWLPFRPPREVPPSARRRALSLTSPPQIPHLHFPFQKVTRLLPPSSSLPPWTAPSAVGILTSTLPTP